MKIAARTCELMNEVSCQLFKDDCPTTIEVNDYEHTKENHKRVKKLYRNAIKVARAKLGIAA